MSSYRQYFTNSAWLMGEQVLTLATTFIISVFLARYLGPELYGDYSYILAFVALITPLASLGLNAIVTREIVKGVAQLKVLTCSFMLRGIGATLAALIVIILTLLFRDKIAVDYEWMLIFALVNLMSAFYVIDFYFQAQVASKYLVLVRLSLLVITSLAKILGLIYAMDLSFFLWVAFANIAFKGIGYLLAYFYYNARFFDKITVSALAWDKGYALNLIEQSKWLIFSGFMYAVCLKVDQLMLGQMIGSSAVGIYAIAAKLSEVWYFIPAAIVSSFFPKLLKLQTEKDAYYGELQRLCSALLIIALSIAILVCSVSPWLIPIAFGEHYIAAVAILNIHVWGGCFIFMRALLSKWLIAEGLLRFSLFTHGIAAVINLILNWFLIPVYGGVGAAYATVISYACSSYILLWCQPKTWPMAQIMTRALLFPWYAMAAIIRYWKH